MRHISDNREGDRMINTSQIVEDLLYEYGPEKAVEQARILYAQALSTESLDVITDWDTIISLLEAEV